MAVVMTADNMGQTITLFDSSAGPLPIYGKKSTLELNQPGSFEFTLVIGHPAYQNLKEFVTYVKVVQDGEELFYGRVLSIQPSPMEGQEIVTCEGALSFLNDGELHKDEQNPNDSSAPEHQTMTAGAFLQRCLDAFNREIGDDPRRALGMGTVSHSKVNEEKEYEVTSYIKVKNAIEQFLLDDYGGFIRIRPDGRGGHCLDWMEDTNQPNNAAIQLGENVIDAKHTISADGIFTAVRAIGNDDLKLSGSEVRDVYDGEQMQEYGRIVHTIQFDTDDQDELETMVSDLIDSITKTSYIASDIKLVDMHLIDGSKPSVKLGDQFTNIIGLEGIEMTVQTRTYDFDNPQNDSCTLKNSKEFDVDYSNKASAGGSTGSSISGQTSSNSAQSWKYYSEVGDAAIINAKNIQLLGDLIEIHAKQLVTTANEIITLSRRSGDLEENVATMNGTGVIQNSDMITQVAGIFGYGWRLVSQTVLDTPGLNPSEEGYYNAHQITTTDADIGSGRELYATLTDILTGNRVDTKNIHAGEYYYELSESTDTSVVPNKNYYYRTLSVSRGTEIFMDDSGQEVTVKSSILEIKDNVTTIEGSALWTKRDAITGVVGEFDVVVDTVTGERTIVVKSGGGIKVERDGTALGLYDEGNLTGGIITNKLADGTVVTKISGDIVNLNANSGYAQLVVDKNAIQATVQDHTTTISTHTRRLGDIEYEVSNMQGSALWQNRNDITAVAGEFDVVSYPDGSKKLVVKSGGGLKIERNGTEFGVYDNGSLTAGVIVDKINGGTATIQAAKILLEGTTKLNDVLTVDTSNARFSRPIFVSRGGSYSYISDNLVSTTDIHATGAVTLLSGNAYYDLDYATVSGMIKSASVSGNTLTLTKFDDSTINFSKATTLSGAWSSSNGKQYVVTASPQGTTHTLTLDSRLNGTSQYSNFSAETGTSTSSGLSVNSSLTIRGYLVETVSGASSYVDVKSGSTSGTVVARISTTATYNAGRNAVNIGTPTWNSVSSIGTTRTLTVSTTGRPTNVSASKTLYINAGTWSSGTITINLRENSSTGTVVAKTSVTVPAVASTKWVNTTGRTWRVDLSIGGATRSSSAKNFDTYYNSGHVAGLADYYDSGLWSHPAEGSSGNVMIPNRTNTKSEVWFTIPSSDYDITEIGTDTCPASSVQSYLAGWNPVRVSGVPDAGYQEYTCIWFKVGGRKKSFYFA